MNDSLISKKDSDDSETAIVLPLKKRDLGNFISSLLGQQQSIERDLEVKFDIDHAWLVNLHELLDQRISQQADSKLVSFVSTIYFEKGLRRTLSSVEAFKAYTETKKVIPLGIKMVWSYLIQFPGRSYPEKQEISFSAQIHSDERNAKNKKKSTAKFEKYAFEMFDGKNDRSTLSFNIDHTERTWGDDLEVIISNQIDDVARGNEIRNIFFNVSRLVFAIGVLFFCMAYPLISMSNATAPKIKVLFEQYKIIEEAKRDEFAVLNEKLNSLAAMTREIGVKDENISYGLFLLFFAPFFFVFILRVTRLGSSSFLVLSKEAEKHREKMLRRESRSYLLVFVSYVFAILSGIFSNYGYAWLTAN